MAASVEYNDESLEPATKKSCRLLGISVLKPEQQQGAVQLLLQKNFFCHTTYTGYGKSSIYQVLWLAAYHFP